VEIEYDIFQKSALVSFSFNIIKRKIAHYSCNLKKRTLTRKPDKHKAGAGPPGAIACGRTCGSGCCRETGFRIKGYGHLL